MSYVTTIKIINKCNIKMHHATVNATQVASMPSLLQNNRTVSGPINPINNVFSTYLII